MTTWQRTTCASTSAQFCTTLPATVIGLVNPAMTWPSAEIGTPWWHAWMISSASIAFMMNGDTVPGLMMATLCSRRASTLPMRATMSSNMNGTASRLKACIHSGLVVFCIWMLSAWTSALSAGTSIGVWMAQMSAWSRTSMIWHHSA